MDNRDCSLEAYDNCTTRVYVDKVIQNCGCLPLNMITGVSSDTNNVSLCNPKQLNCVKNISLDDHNCKQKCQGLFITGFDKIGFEDFEKDGFLSRVLVDYNYYKAKKILSYPSSMKGLFIISTITNSIDLRGDHC